MSAQNSFFPVENTEEFKKKLFRFVTTFDTFSWFDSNSYPDSYGTYELLAGAGAKRTLAVSSHGAFEALKQFRDERPSWLMGYLSYDLKNDVEKLASANSDNLYFPELFFFEPEVVFAWKNGKLHIFSEKASPEELFQGIIHSDPYPIIQASPVIRVRQRISKDKYLDIIRHIREHILEGDIYEMNFCQEFYAENAVIDPFSIYLELNKISPTPFSAFIKTGEHYILCASPERFLKKTGSALISQPIKGTIRRGSMPEEDKKLEDHLLNDEKERAENVMIVDLVRNDLSRSAEPASVKVDELFGIYSFVQVHQMISTVSARLRKDVHLVDAIKKAYPMGSMTGAPKIMAMKLIEQYEQTKRGVFSGSAGYFSPEGDFDFNVIIRTLLYNAGNRYLSFQAGSAITYDSDPEKEYEECLLKAKAIMQVLKG